MNWIVPLCHSSIADYGAEKILKKLAGRTDVEDAILQLDMLTKEESLMVVVRNLEVTLSAKIVTGDVKRSSLPDSVIVERQC